MTPEERDGRELRRGAPGGAGAGRVSWAGPCECGCPRLLHRGPAGEGACQTHGPCREFAPASDRGWPPRDTAAAVPPGAGPRDGPGQAAEDAALRDRRQRDAYRSHLCQIAQTGGPPSCPRCGSEDGILGTENAYFVCRSCHGTLFWLPGGATPSPDGWEEAVAASPWGRPSRLAAMWRGARAELADARAGLARWEEREAAACPEDRGFEETVAGLRRELAAARALLGRSRSREAVRAAGGGYKWSCDCGDGALPYGGCGACAGTGWRHDGPDPRFLETYGCACQACQAHNALEAQP